MLSLSIADESDVAEVVRQARQMAVTLGFATVQTYYIATSASELASNLLIHASGGVVELLPLSNPPGLEMMTTDCGPGIADIDKALQDGYSTAGGLGCGLPGVQRLMDELDIKTWIGMGTLVRARKWL